MEQVESLILKISISCQRTKMEQVGSLILENYISQE